MDGDGRTQVIKLGLGDDLWFVSTAHVQTTDGTFTIDQAAGRVVRIDRETRLEEKVSDDAHASGHYACPS